MTHGLTRSFCLLRASRLALVATPLLLLGGCISLGGKAPPYLLTLTPDVAPQAGPARTGAAGDAVTILEPTVPQKLRTLRIPVQADNVAIAYVKDGQWVEAPARQMQRLLSETVAAKTGRIVLDNDQYVTAPGTQLVGELLDFGVDARTNEAVVVYEAMRLGKGGATVSKRRFEAREPVTIIEGKPVGEALNRAANRVASDVAAWVGG